MSRGVHGDFRTDRGSRASWACESSTVTPLSSLERTLGRRRSDSSASTAPRPMPTKNAFETSARAGAAAEINCRLGRWQKARALQLLERRSVYLEPKYPGRDFELDPYNRAGQRSPGPSLCLSAWNPVSPAASSKRLLTTLKEAAYLCSCLTILEPAGHVLDPRQLGW
jgi:hypothetical protein